MTEAATADDIGPKREVPTAALFPIPAISDFVERAFVPGSGSIAAALEQRFDTRYLRFSDSVGTLAPGERLAFTGARSDLARALEQVARAPDATSRK